MTAVFRLAATVAVVPQMAAAHDAFGNIGAFYKGLLHPFVDPAQGLVVAGAAVLLGRLPLATVRPAFAAFAGGALAAASAAAVAGHLPVPTAMAMALFALAFSLGALIRLPLPVPAATVLGASAGALAALALDPPSPDVPAGLAVSGGVAGIALLGLLVLAGVEWSERNLHPAAGAVAGSWVAAVALIYAVLAGGLTFA